MSSRLQHWIMFANVVLLFSSVPMLVLQGCGSSKPHNILPAGEGLPMVEREFRGVWVASVSNIDWPSAPGLPPDSQRTEARAILDSAVRIGLNAIVLQVRPQCDAFYRSELEPWSYYLTGLQGKPPDPYYDPLSFWVEEAHARGLELHAWFNPYRAHLPNGGEISAASIVRKRPHLAKRLPNGMYWLDPARSETQDHSFGVVMDVVRRYDIDGVHFDDYFYPYGDGSFPDDDSWSEYIASGGTMRRDDWRRSAVNSFVQRVYEGIKAEKPFVKFGVSPFGIWRPGNPPSISGFDQYAILYADARLWINQGWLDYWSPQLYWPINQISQSFPVLLGWWNKENTQGRNVWPGMFTSRMTGEKGIDEIINQIMVTRGMVPQRPGHIHFSMKSFLRDTIGLLDTLRRSPYRNPALVPPSPWLDDVAPASPDVKTTAPGDSIRLTWSHPSAGDVFRWVLYYKYGRRWEYTLVSRKEEGTILPLKRLAAVRQRAANQNGSTQDSLEHLSSIALSAIDRAGNESRATLVSVGTITPSPPAHP